MAGFLRSAILLTVTVILTYSVINNYTKPPNPEPTASPAQTGSILHYLNPYERMRQRKIKPVVIEECAEEVGSVADFHSAEGKYFFTFDEQALQGRLCAVKQIVLGIWDSHKLDMVNLQLTVSVVVAGYFGLEFSKMFVKRLFGYAKKARKAVDGGKKESQKREAAEIEKKEVEKEPEMAEIMEKPDTKPFLYSTPATPDER